jgi:two-component system sensor histidine kinase KdpD
MAGDEPQVEGLSLRTLRKRGHLKVFLGYAPGVGKTFTMLAEAHRRAQRGEDIVIGFVEPHDRQETRDLTLGLEQVQLKVVEYRGKRFEELDTAAVIARNPECVLVDELAHTNVPGTTHEKRWQSVEEILAAGISVHTTVNVQHIESLNDSVFQITSVRVQETVPDSVVDRADEVVLVDLTAAALLNRLRRGVVYDLDKIPGALANFFRPGNLVALRELALRKTAEEVDDSLERYIAEHEPDHAWTTEDRIVVCVRPGEVATKLVRRGYRLAKRFQGHFYVLHVKTPGQMLGPHRKEMDRLFDLATELGGEAVERDGDSVAAEVLRFAGEVRATFIVLGQSRRSRMDEVLRGSALVAKVMRSTEHVDILLVADPSKAHERP